MSLGSNIDLTGAMMEMYSVLLFLLCYKAWSEYDFVCKSLMVCRYERRSRNI